MSDRLMLLVAQVDHLMAQQRLSQAELARLMGHDPGTVCRLLQGSDARISTLLAAAQALGCDVALIRRS